MKISEKIYKYMEMRNLRIQDLSELLGMNRTTLSAMLNERNRFSQEFFEAICLKCEDIDINKLLNPRYDSFMKSNLERPESIRIEELENSLHEIKKIVSNIEI